MEGKLVSPSWFIMRSLSTEADKVASNAILLDIDIFPESLGSIFRLSALALILPLQAPRLRLAMCLFSPFLYWP